MRKQWQKSGQLCLPSSGCSHTTCLSQLKKWLLLPLRHWGPKLILPRASPGAQGVQRQLQGGMELSGNRIPFSSRFIFSRVWPTAEQPMRWWDWEGGCLSKDSLCYGGSYRYSDRCCHLLQDLKWCPPSQVFVGRGGCRARWQVYPEVRCADWKVVTLARRYQTSSVAARTSPEWAVHIAGQNISRWMEGRGCFAEVEIGDCHDPGNCSQSQSQIQNCYSDVNQRQKMGHSKCLAEWHQGTVKTAPRTKFCPISASRLGSFPASAAVLRPSLFYNNHRALGKHLGSFEWLLRIKKTTQTSTVKSHLDMPRHICLLVNTWYKN